MRTFLVTLFFLLFSITPVLGQDLNGVEISAALGSLSDAGNIAGFSEAATLEYDSGIDLPEPPLPPGSYLAVSFLSMNNAPAWYEEFREDWRADSFDPATDTAVFPIRIRTSETTGLIELTFTLGDLLALDAPVALFHDGIYQNLREAPTFSYDVSVQQDRTVSLIIGTPPEPTITFANPADNPLFVSGEQETLTWDVDGEVVIEETVVDISLDNGDSWSTLVEEGDLVESAAWTIPAQSTEAGQLRVEVLDHLDRRSSSVAAFRIQDQTEWLTGIEVTSPEATAHLVDGEMIDISWTYEGGDENVSGATVEYRIGDTPYQLIEDLTGTSTSTTWTPPSEVFSNSVTIRVTAEVSEGDSYFGTRSDLTIWPVELLNDNFEVWTEFGAEVGPPDDWATSREGYGTAFEVIRSDENQVEGFYSARLEAFEAGSFSLFQEIANPVEGTQVTMRVALLDNDAGMTGRIVLSALDSSGEVLTSSSSDGTTNSTDFQTAMTSITVPASSAALRLEIEASATDDSYLLADLVRIDQSSPNPEIIFSSPTAGDVFTYDGESSFEVTWSYGATAPFVESAVLEVSLDEGENWQQLATFSDASTTTYEWPGEDSYSLRTQFRITATNNEGVDGSGTSDFLVLRPSERSITLDGGWHLISIPLEADEMTVESILQDDLPSANVYEYQSTLDPVYVLSSDLQMGQGYWLGTDQPATFDIAGTAEIESISTQLTDGWNLVGSGFPVSIPIGNLTFADEQDTLSFSDAVDEGWVAATLFGTPDETGIYTQHEATEPLDQWAGYWLGVLDGPRTMILPAPLPGQIAAIVRPERSLDDIDEEEEFIAPVLLLVNSTATSRVEVGQMLEASADYDPQFDQPAPPASPAQQTPVLTLVNEAMALPTGDAYLRDVHPCLSEEMPSDIWHLVVSGPMIEGLALDFSEMMAMLPEGYEARLQVGTSTYDPSTDPFVPLDGFDPGLISLEIWSPNLSTPLGETGLPSNFALGKIWPNPFNASVNLEVLLPVRSSVTVQLVDVTGRLAGEWSRELQAGRRTVTLKPSVSSGVYLVRIALPNGESRSGKVVVLK